MTINGPAPMILAMYMNTAIDQRVEKFLRDAGRWGDVEAALASAAGEGSAPGRVTAASCRRTTTAPDWGC